MPRARGRLMRELIPLPVAASAAVLVVAGVAILIASGGDGAAGVIGLVLLGLGAIGGTALAFYGVGRSEDLARERERRRRPRR